MTVGRDVYFSIAVGSKNLRTDVPVALEDFRCGVAEVIGPAGTEDGDAGLEGAQELWRAGCQAAVVRHFKDSQRSRVDVANQRALNSLADVAGHHERHVAPAQFEDDRVVVPDFLALPVRWCRMKHRDLEPVDLNMITGEHVPPQQPVTE